MAMKFPGMKEQEQNEPTPDVGVLPKSGGKSLDKSGIKDTGYLEKKGTPSGLNARFNYLPPGMNIENQENADIREQKMLTYTGGITYPGDGWT
jgi:hypothetical protein